MNQPCELISEADFHDVWQVVTKKSGDLFQHSEISGCPIRNIWTIVESGEDENQNWYAIPGIHLVSCLGFVLTRKEWADESIHAIYFEDDAEEESESE